MFVHLVLGVWGFIAPVLLYQMTGKGPFRNRAATIVGAVSGATCGAGMAMGLFFQSTTANIHSGYSFAVVGQWLSLAAVGGVIGLAVGVVLARWALSWRPAVAVFLVCAMAAAAGWVVAAARPEIDCDENPTFCDERYG